MGRIVVVDDIRLSADRRALHCCNTVEAVELFTLLIQSGEEVDQLWLDYDMSNNRGIGEQTTIPIAEWLISNNESRTPLIIKNVYVHSRHPSASILVTMLEPHFHVGRADLPDPMWWEQPEDNDSDELDPTEDVGWNHPPQPTRRNR